MWRAVRALPLFCSYCQLLYGQGLSSVQGIRYRTGNLSGLPMSKKKIAFNHSTHTSLQSNENTCDICLECSKMHRTVKVSEGTPCFIDAVIAYG